MSRWVALMPTSPVPSTKKKPPRCAPAIMPPGTYHGVIGVDHVAGDDDGPALYASLDKRAVELKAKFPGVRVLLYPLQALLEAGCAAGLQRLQLHNDPYSQRRTVGVAIRRRCRAYSTTVAQDCPNQGNVQISKVSNLKAISTFK